MDKLQNLETLKKNVSRALFVRVGSLVLFGACVLVSIISSIYSIVTGRGLIESTYVAWTLSGLMFAFVIIHLLSIRLHLGAIGTKERLLENKRLEAQQEIERRRKAMRTSEHFRVALNHLVFVFTKDVDDETIAWISLWLQYVENGDCLEGLFFFSDLEVIASRYALGGEKSYAIFANLVLCGFFQPDILHGGDRGFRLSYGVWSELYRYHEFSSDGAEQLSSLSEPTSL